MVQKEKELENKRIIEEIIKRKDELKEYYNSHSYKETLMYFNLKSYKQLKKILIEIDYDFNYKKKHNITKGRKSSRSHESYVLGGKKSSQTQKTNWKNKSNEEKLAWSTKQTISHDNEQFKLKISKANKEYQKSLSENERTLLNKKRSTSMKNWWSSLSCEEKERQIANHFEHGAGWNHEKIKETIAQKYGVSNISQLDELKKQSRESMMKTCMEKYGVMWNCQLEQCKNSIGAKGSHTKINENFAKLLDSLDINYVREFSLDKFIYDFKVGNILIEINPSATHNSTWSPFGNPLDKKYHQQKTECAFKHNFRCIHVFDWDDVLKITNLLKQRKIIGARTCKIKEVSKIDAMTFINDNHLQGYARDNIRIGLYLKDELISIMTFNKPRYNKHYEYELIRYCSSYNVIGGAEKLFKYFLDNYKPKSILTYCDTSKFSGDIYSKLGFKLLRKGRPSRHWYNIKTHEHYTDNLIRQQGFSRIVNHVDASSDCVDSQNNVELMLKHGFVEIYDSGQDAYVY